MSKGTMRRKNKTNYFGAHIDNIEGSHLDDHQNEKSDPRDPHQDLNPQVQAGAAPRVKGGA
jgi:hypothetical protein